MTAFRPRTNKLLARLWSAQFLETLVLPVVLLTLFTGAACTTHPTLPPARMLEPLAQVPAQPPVASERAAARVAAAALANQREASERALSELATALRSEEAERQPRPAHDGEARGQSDAPALAQSSGRSLLSDAPDRSALLPLAMDLRNATLADPRDFRSAARELLKRNDLNPAHRARLEQAAADDPLRLASARNRDSYEALWAQTFNAVSAPLGRSLLSGFAAAPYEITMSAVHWTASMFERPSLDTYERQALGHWDTFLSRYPDAPEAPAIRARADTARAQLQTMHRDHFVAASTLALKKQQPRLARAQAQRALALLPDDLEAQELLAAAEEKTQEQRTRRQGSSSWEASEEATSPLRASKAQLELLQALWTQPPERLIETLRRAQQRLRRDQGAQDSTQHLAGLSGALRFAVATAQYEIGYEGAAWDAVDALAHEAPETQSMARHAAALAANPWQNPHRSFGRELMRGRERAVASEVFGRWSRGPRYRALPTEVAYLIDAPAIAQTALSTPFRLLLSPFANAPKQDHRRGAAVAAYRYLDRKPRGEFRREYLRWLFEYEKGRGNALAALRLADAIPDFDRDERLELAEKAAQQQFESAARTGRRDLRAAMLRGVVREFPESEAGRDAGIVARRDREEASAQRIRLTRGFLSENPQIVGPLGLALDPSLTDGAVRNGELHPIGISFLGARVVELALIAESGDEEDPPDTRRVEISTERLARSIALLDEAATLGVQLDQDDSQELDASRDHYFERARLGLTEKADVRPSAESTYVYRGLRERYGLVRGRDSILPFDLVLQGSFDDLRLGAFPRWRTPEQTPDAFLYR